MTNLDSVLKSRDITLPTKVCLVRAMVFPVVMYGCELDHKEGWMPNNWRFQTVVLEKTLKSLLDCKEMKPVNPKGNQSCIFIGRTVAKADTPILWSPDVKNWLIGKDPDAGKDWRQEEKGVTKDEMVGWHHWGWASGHEFEQTQGDSEGQRSLSCCSPWGRKKSQIGLSDWTTTTMDCSPLGSSVHGISQARILEWVAIPFSRVSFQPRDWSWIFCIAHRFFTVWVPYSSQFLLISNSKFILFLPTPRFRFLIKEASKEGELAFVTPCPPPWFWMWPWCLELQQ